MPRYLGPSCSTLQVAPDGGTKLLHFPQGAHQLGALHREVLQYALDSSLSSGFRSDSMRTSLDQEIQSLSRRASGPFADDIILLRHHFAFGAPT